MNPNLVVNFVKNFGWSAKNFLAFSDPWPIFRHYRSTTHRFWMIQICFAIFTNSHLCVKFPSPVHDFDQQWLLWTGGATLFFTTLILISLPTLLSFWSPVPLIWVLFPRTSRRTEARRNLGARPPGDRFRVPKHDPNFFTQLVDKDGNGLGLIDQLEFTHLGSSSALTQTNVAIPISPSISAHWYQGRNRSQQ